MDPVTGLAALAGISLATVAGLRLKKEMETEAFSPLPDTTTKYADSVAESQSRYNMFSGLVNPITNSLIPVGSSSNTVNTQKQLVNDTLGSYDASFSPDSSQTLVLRKFENQFKPRSDSSRSLYGAMQFCREAGKQQSPFTVFNSDGSVRTQGAVSQDGQWRFDEVCGVCLTSGVDEEGKRFRTPQGMLVEPGARGAALDVQKQNGWPYPRIGPSMGTCEGAPGSPAFAVTGKDLAAFRARQTCLQNKTLGGTDNCALCYDSDSVFSSVGPQAQTNPIAFQILGTGNAQLLVRGTQVQSATLSESSPTRFELGANAKEGDSFVFDVRAPAGATNPITIYGYMFATQPNEGLFTMPLNLLVTIDDETGSAPSRSGGFHTFSDVGLDVAKIRAGPGKTRMRLRGSIPFTFVQSSEFSAMDCLTGPYQKLASSANAFSTDQPCFAKGSGPGKYNDACLRQRVLDAGCTNAGTLYQNPQQLNTKAGAAQTLSQIYAALQGVAALDMVDTEATRQCSGRTIDTPCDPFIQRAGTLKFRDALNSGNRQRATQAQQCLSFLYHNRGANETTNPPRVGPTYTALTLFRNNQREIKNIYCLPEGALNPDTNSSARETLARIGDTSYKNKIGVEAIKQFLQDQLALATDVSRNANTDPDRKAAITNCFGTNLNSLPAIVTGTPNVITNPCGVVAQYVRVLPSQSVASNEAFIEISQLVVINKNGQNVAPGKSTTGTTEAYPPHGFGTHEASFAIDGQIYPKGQNFYISRNPGGNSQFLLNLGSPMDITKIIYITRGAPTNLTYRKNGIRLQLLDSNQMLVNERLLNSSAQEEISYLQSGAAASCQSSLPVQAPLAFPAGFTTGLFARFFAISSPNPDITPGNRGWGGRIGTSRAYTNILFNDGNLARADGCGLVVRGYYIAPQAERLYLMTDSDDGIYVAFNNVQSIRNWSIHAPQRDVAAVINIPAAGVYPFELRFYEWGGGAVCNLFYRVNDEATWRTDLTARFAYKPEEIFQEERTATAMFGPWIPGTVDTQRIFQLPNGELVYAIFDAPYTKMVTQAGVARYYTGSLNQFNASSWSSYANAGTNYRLKFK